MRSKWLLLLALLLVGCDRAYYRRAADRDAYALTASRIVDPAFDVGRTRVEPDPTSRLADPLNPDRPPKPPDDPSAAIFMERPGDRKGGKHWDRYGFTDEIEHAGWVSFVGLNEKGRLPLTQERAMELALNHSREYQTRVESLYLVALGLSQSRFQFSPQWFGGQDTTFSRFGTGGAANGETNTLTLDQRLGLTKALGAGGQFLLDFANSYVWEFTGGGGKLVTSNLVFNLIQPLLRGASREVRMESLTQDERELLYAVRDFARFRKQFWADVTTQEGYLNLLLQVQGIRNEQANLTSQEQNYRLHRELFDGGKVSRVQVDRAFRGFLAARLSVAQAEALLQTSQDAFKLRLGLPPRMPVDLDDSMLAQFQLTPPELDKLREEIENYQLARFKELNKLPTIESLRRSIGELRSLAARAPQHLDNAARNLDKGLLRLDGPMRPGQDADQVRRTRQDFERFRSTLADVRKDLDSLPGKLDDDDRALDEITRDAVWSRLNRHTRDFLGHLDDLIAVQTVVRINEIELPELNETEDAAICYAHEHRLDLMNARGAVTDAWRKVTVAANGLRSDLTLTATANLGNDPAGGNPLGFSATRNRYTIGFAYDAPLNRFAERNLYRISLINYQQARRGFMELADRIEQRVRLDLRQLGIERLSFEIARQNLVSAARQVESARAQILSARDSSGTSSTLDILDALSALLQARNALARSYISYEQLRVQLLLDLERLQLDSRGFPIHEPTDAPPSAPPGGRPEALPAPGPAG